LGHGRGGGDPIAGQRSARKRNGSYVLLVLPVLVLGVGVAPATAAKAKKYANCAALNKVYPHRVGKKGARDKTRASR
jgi:hypothetical protein